MGNDDIVPGFDDEKYESLRIILQKIAEADRCLVLNLAGYIDTYNASYFKKCVQKAIEMGFIRLIFQCGELSYISSDGIGSFSGFMKTLRPKGGDFVLFNVQPKVYEVFQLLGFSSLFNIKDSLDDSIKFFINEKNLLPG